MGLMSRQVACAVRFAVRLRGRRRGSTGFVGLRRRVVSWSLLAVLLALSGGEAVAAGGPFGWFAPAPAPAGWRHLTLPANGAVLSYPPSLTRIRSDPGSVSVERKDSKGDILAYLNATPQQGAEKLSTWPSFRVEHHLDENAISDRVLGKARLSFRGGTGSCLIDDYVTRVGHNSYREIACFVVGRHAGSVIIAAGSTSSWQT